MFRLKKFTHELSHTEHWESSSVCPINQTTLGQLSQPMPFDARRLERHGEAVSVRFINEQCTRGAVHPLEIWVDFESWQGRALHEPTFESFCASNRILSTTAGIFWGLLPFPSGK